MSTDRFFAHIDAARTIIDDLELLYPEAERESYSPVGGSGEPVQGGDVSNPTESTFRSRGYARSRVKEALRLVKQAEDKLKGAHIACSDVFDGPEGTRGKHDHATAYGKASPDAIDAYRAALQRIFVELKEPAVRRAVNKGIPRRVAEIVAEDFFGRHR